MPKPPASVRNAAKRALEARENVPDSRKAMTPVGVKRAADLARGANISINTLKRMVSFLSRHRANYLKAKAQGKNAKTSKSIQSYLGWGGTSALAWAKSEIKKAGK